MSRHMAGLVGKKIANYKSVFLAKNQLIKKEIGMRRVDRRLFPRLHEGFEMAVKGVDMFGAPFLEKHEAFEPEPGRPLLLALEASFSWRKS